MSDPREDILAWLRRRAAADTQMRHAADVRGVEPPQPREVSDRPELTDELTRQHNRIQYLTKQLAAVPGHSRHGSRLQVARRRALAEALDLRVSAHEEAEQAGLWPLVRQVVADGEQWQQRAGQLGIPELVRRLVGADADSSEFDELAAQLIAQTRRHDALCAELFLRLSESADPELLRQLGAQARGAGELGNWMNGRNRTAQGVGS